ncbi:AF4/FMR2 family member 2 [Bagarius yarrelli]|uniref:AF4/FMR2 family member 2 n=1 Tax=Bagarius yarrelli TaxID=175774 RepID=A0A556V5M5_BAGYA|nr:AF4/FMR2 family member 2 [Bagarius yarrelli]
MDLVLPSSFECKTNKGDALANRVQNTLGNYDEMKELLTSHSNQSHLVGIPKNSVPQTPVEKTEQPSFFSEAQRGRAASSQPANHTTSMPPPPTTNMAGPSILHGHQSTKKSRSTDWSRGAHGSGSSQAAQAVSRGKQGSSGNEQEQGDSSPGTSSTSTHPSRRHGQPAKVPTVVSSPCEQDSGSPVASTSLVPGGLSTPTFPQGLHCKPSSGGQQKPTAYVRPMDGQDQAPSDSPELKPSLEITDGYVGTAFTSLMESKGNAVGSKGKLPKLTLPQSGEVVYNVNKKAIRKVYIVRNLELFHRQYTAELHHILDRERRGHGGTLIRPPLLLTDALTPSGVWINRQIRQKASQNRRQDTRLGRQDGN